MFALSPQSLKSTACDREWRYAAALGRPILPVLVADGVPINLLPPALSKIQVVDYRLHDRDAAFGLARAFKDVPSPGSLPNPLPTSPKVPISYLGGLAERIGSADSLSDQDQSALVFELKGALVDPEIANEDVLRLLGELRRRKELLATIATEIDSLMSQADVSPAPERHRQDDDVGERPHHAPSSAEEARADSNHGIATIQQSPPPSSDAISVLARSAWTDLARWEDRELMLRSRLARWRSIAAAGVVIGALLATIAVTAPGGVLEIFFASGGAVVLSVVAGIRRTQISHERIEAWVRARSASTALEGEIYRFLLGVAPYAWEQSDLSLFQQRRLELTARTSELNLEVAAVSPPMDDSRRPLGTLTVDDYIEKRVDDFLDFYNARASRDNLTATRLRNLEFILLLFAAALAGLNSSTVVAGLNSLGLWVAVVTTAAGAVTAYLASGRYDVRAITFNATADRLAALRSGYLGDDANSEPARISEFVDDVENAISLASGASLAS